MPKKIQVTVQLDEDNHLALMTLADAEFEGNASMALRKVLNGSEEIEALKVLRTSES